MALVWLSWMLPPCSYVRWSMVALVLGAACSPSMDPITVARECPNKPYREPEKHSGENRDQLIADFENGTRDLAPYGRRDGEWVLGNESPTPTRLVAQASDDCAAAGRWAGNIVLSQPQSWGANWTAVFRAPTSTGTAVPYDARAYGGISFWAAFGDANEASDHVAFGVTTWDTVWNNTICPLCLAGSYNGTQCAYCNAHYFFSAPLTREWKRYSIRFEDMVQTPAYMPMRRDQLVGFVIWPRQQVDLWVDDIRFEL